jgi:hypothetical protein
MNTDDLLCTRKLKSSQVKSAFTIIFLLAPVIAVAIFIARFSSPFPLTDEWALVLDAMHAESGDWSSFVWRINGHPLIVPFFVYWPVAELFRFDGRAQIGVTIICFALQLLLFQRSSKATALEMIPLSILIFGLSHWMEFLWGMQMAFAVGITSAVWGLWTLNEYMMKGAGIRLLGAMALMIIAASSYGGGALTFLSAMFLIIVRPSPLSDKLAAAVPTMTVGFAILVLASRAPPMTIEPYRDVLFLLTALGALIIGSPETITHFEWGTLPIIGVVVALVACWGMLFGLRDRSGQQPFYLVVLILGITSLAAVSVTRPYLGNWHLQLGLPAIYGAYGLWLAAAKTKPLSPLTKTGFALCATLLCGVLIADYTGFTRRGPDYAVYIAGIERYALDYEREHTSLPPYPAPDARWNLNQDILNFLKRKHNGLFSSYE